MNTAMPWKNSPGQRSHTLLQTSTMRSTRGLLLSCRAFYSTEPVSSSTSPQPTQDQLPPSLQHPKPDSKRSSSAYNNYFTPRTDDRQGPLFTEETRRRLERLRQFQFHPTNIPDSPDFGTNQYISIDEELKQQLKSIVSRFNAPIRYAFAYGSGVFRQSGYDTNKKPMMDFIFGVSHPGHWHALNMQQNPHHYSGLRWLGSSTVSMLQEKVGAGVYFNPYVEIDGMVSLNCGDTREKGKCVIHPTK